MLSAGIRDLKQKVSELIRLVPETGGAVQITHRGRIVALLIPVVPSKNKIPDNRS